MPEKNSPRSGGKGKSEEVSEKELNLLDGILKQNLKVKSKLLELSQVVSTVMKYRRGAGNG